MPNWEKTKELYETSTLDADSIKKYARKVAGLLRENKILFDTGKGWQLKSSYTQERSKGDSSYCEEEKRIFYCRWVLMSDGVLTVVKEMSGENFYPQTGQTEKIPTSRDVHLMSESEICDLDYDFGPVDNNSSSGFWNIERWGDAPDHNRLNSYAKGVGCSKLLQNLLEKHRIKDEFMEQYNMCFNCKYSKVAYSHSHNKGTSITEHAIVDCCLLPKTIRKERESWCGQWGGKPKDVIADEELSRERSFEQIAIEKEYYLKNRKKKEEKEALDKLNSEKKLNQMKSWQKEGKCCYCGGEYERKIVKISLGGWRIFRKCKACAGKLGIHTDVEVEAERYSNTEYRGTFLFHALIKYLFRLDTYKSDWHELTIHDVNYARFRA